MTTPKHPRTQPACGDRAFMRALGDAALLEAMRRGEEAAFREFIVRFEKQLDQNARRLGLAGGERRTIVAETLDDAALMLIIPGRATPRSLPAYLIVALRNRLRNELRSRKRSSVREGQPGTHAADDSDGSLLYSEAARRDSAGPAWEPAAASPAVVALSAALVGDLTEEERVLLVWVSHHVPYREIAAWLDVGYAAVGKRVERLRTRLRARAEQYLDSLPDAERSELRALLARGAIPGRLDPLSAVAPRVTSNNTREGVSR